MDVSLTVWLVTILVILGFFVFDFYSHVKTPHAPTIKESALWSLFYIVISIIFGLGLWFFWQAPGDPHKYGLEFFSGYLTEKALSVDNLFVFALILGAFQVPRKYQQKVLLFGIVMALVFRGIFIALGAAVIDRWSAVFYIFGIFLLYTAIKMIVDTVTDKPDPDPKDMGIVKFVKRFFPVTDDYDGDKMLTHTPDGKRAMTPLFIAFMAIAGADLIFALDSIPAIYGLTQEPYIVFTANAFALLGLRQMYFLLDGLLDRLYYLPYGLSLILGFIAVKLVLHAMHTNNLPFINDGQPIEWAPDIDSVASIGFIIVTLIITTVASVVRNKRHPVEAVLEQEKVSAELNVPDAQTIASELKNSEQNNTH